MAWTYEQLFNTLNDGDLDGQDSWAATGISTDFLVSTDASARYEGAKGLSLPSTSLGNYRRASGDTTTGTVYYAMKYTAAAATGDGAFLALKNSTTYGAITKFAQIGGVNKLQYYSGGAADYIDAVSPAIIDTWYVIQLAYDTTTGGFGSYQIGVNGGSLSSAVTNLGNCATGYTVIELGNDGTTGWVCQMDTITPTNPYTPPAGGLTTRKSLLGVGK